MDRPSSAKARGIGAIVAIAAVAITAFAAAKHLSMGGLAEAEISRGEAAVGRFVEGDAMAIEDAEEAFKDAASVSPFDHYPAFGLSMSRRLAELEQSPAGESRPGDEVLRALSNRDWDAARSAVDEMRDDAPERANYFDRFVEGVRQSSMNVE